MASPSRARQRPAPSVPPEQLPVHAVPGAAEGIPGVAERTAWRNLLGEGYARFALAAATLLGCSLFWVAPRPPMGDLAQHAGQVTLLHDLFTGTSRWADLVHVHAFTPYLVGYALATVLSLVMPALAAVKVVLTLSYVAFVVLCVRLGEQLGSDRRLVWLFLPGFFGFAFQVGMYTFLVASPVGLLFVSLAHRHADDPTRARGLVLLAAGTVLFFCHGLVFALACAIGIAFGLARGAPLAARLAPYAFFALLALAYVGVAHATDPLLSAKGTDIIGASQFDWEWQHSWGWHRVPSFLVFPLGSTLRDHALVPFAALLFAAPLLVGARAAREDRSALAPLAAVLLIGLLAPSVLMRTQYVYHRFALFLLPAYALAFRPASGTRRAGDTDARESSVRRVAGEAAVALACCAFLALLALRERRFAAESASFEPVLAAAAPGERALGIVASPDSPAVHYEYAHHSDPVWYQAERDGFVDFNFAAFLPQIVRFRPDHDPGNRGDVTGSSDRPDVDTRLYRYFFVRHLAPLPPDFFEAFRGDGCPITLVTESLPWSLYERHACK
jgi:hypothetical protein